MKIGHKKALKRKKHKIQDFLDFLEKSTNRMFLLKISDEAERNSKMLLKKSIFNLKKKKNRKLILICFTLKKSKIMKKKINC